MTLPVLLSATRHEVAPLFAAKHQQCSPTHYQFAHYHLVLHGVGLLRTYHTLHQLPTSLYQAQWFSVGCAGALKELPFLQPIPIASVARPSSPHPWCDVTAPRILTTNTTNRLLSLDTPCHDPTWADRLQKEGDLVDMEGYAIALFAQAEQIPLTMVKWISDDARQQQRPMVHKVAQAIAHFWRVTIA